MLIFVLPPEIQRTVPSAPGRATEECMMAGEVIFVQTDPTFNLVLLAMKQLRDNERLPVGRTTWQTAYITRIERALEEGANDDLCYTWNSRYDFARTAGVCFRMAMLEAMGIPRNCWPRMQSIQQNTRAGNMGHHPDVMPFQLANTQEGARQYWSYYDRLYPHYYISERYSETAQDASVPLNSMMVIFRNNFKEMIEITTTVRLQKGAASAGVYDASVHVLCVRREIDPGDDKKTPAFQQLQAICKGEEAVKARNILGDFITEATEKMDELAIQH